MLSTLTTEGVSEMPLNAIFETNSGEAASFSRERWKLERLGSGKDRPMRRLLTFVELILVAGAGLLLCRQAVAQHGAGMASGARVGAGVSQRAVAAPRVYSAPSHLAVRIPVARNSSRIGSGPARGRGTSGRTTRRANVVPFGPIGETDFQDVPGLGFDYPHLAAVSGNRQHRQRFGGVFPFGFDGVFLPTAPMIVEEAQPAAEAPASDERADDDERFYRSRSRRVWEPTDSPAPAPSSANSARTQEDATEYVFVRRDGSLLFAVAYSWENGTLLYVTRDGLRRSVARDVLDLSATEQFNEQRGLTFHLPA